MENNIKSAVAGLGAIAGYIFGELQGILLALIVMMAIDYLTGVVIAVAKKNLSSEIGFRGLCKKMLILGIVAVANLVDKSLLGDSAILRTAACAFYIANEGLSILENSANLGLPMPKKLLDVLKQLRKEEEERK